MCGLTEDGLQVERVITRYSVRKIETRGDCYAVVCGTNFSKGDTKETQVCSSFGPPSVSAILASAIPIFIIIH